MKTKVVVTFETGSFVRWTIDGAVAYSIAMEKIMEIIHRHSLRDGAVKSFSVEYKEV